MSKNAKYELVALGVARGLTLRESAVQTGVNVRTAERWAGTAEFQSRVDELRAGLLSATLDRITGGMSEAVDKLRELLSNTDAAIQVRAAVALLSNGIRLREHGELVARIEQLERLLAGKSNTPGRLRT